MVLEAAIKYLFQAVFLSCIARLGLSTHADPRKEQRKEAGEFVATAGVHDYYDTATLAEADQLRQAATKRGDFTPLTTAYKALGGMTVFDEMLVRQAIKSKIVSTIQCLVIICTAFDPEISRPLHVNK